MSDKRGKRKEARTAREETWEIYFRGKGERRTGAPSSSSVHDSSLFLITGFASSTSPRCWAPPDQNRTVTAGTCLFLKPMSKPPMITLILSIAKICEPWYMVHHQN